MLEAFLERGSFQKASTMYERDSLLLQQSA